MHVTGVRGDRRPGCLAAKPSPHLPGANQPPDFLELLRCRGPIASTSGIKDVASSQQRLQLQRQPCRRVSAHARGISPEVCGAADQVALPLYVAEDGLGNNLL